MHWSPYVWMDIWQCVQETGMPTEHHLSCCTPCIRIQSYCGEDCKGSNRLSREFLQRGQDNCGVFCLPHLHMLWFIFIWRVLSAASSQMHQGGRCCSGLGVEEVSGCFMSMWVAAKLIKVIKKDDFFFIISCKWALQCYLISSHDVTF